MGWMVVGMSEGKAAERGFARVTSAVRSMGRRHTSATSRGCGRYDSFHCLNTTPRGVTHTLSLSPRHTLRSNIIIKHIRIRAATVLQRATRYADIRKC
jgi:hypothetical protein